ncbi:helix-turn-helix domain-containing protein [Protofrankia symbiont of Coriaria ruscifolia]|uniref:helix-turn-helix domain-containing protein n=1 Tax=Protofrankia symbiont of Coriaria ruscifolia TaxID=1306542 RepID=UPI001F5F049E|nr:helix-turn-helix transcriptional regulator [Protofrankia symbiont of Coriaria ruscifolia]
MSTQVGYHWHLRRLMADRGLFATTALVPLLAERGVGLSREQVYRLVTGVPERLSLATLAALCDILDCTPTDLVEPYRGRPRRTAGPAPATTSPAVTPLRPRRAEITAVPGPGTVS